MIKLELLMISWMWVPSGVSSILFPFHFPAFVWIQAPSLSILTFPLFRRSFLPRTLCTLFYLLFGASRWLLLLILIRFFYLWQFIAIKMRENEIWRNDSEQEFDNAVEGMEKLVMNRVFHLWVFRLVVNEAPDTSGHKRVLPSPKRALNPLALLHFSQQDFRTGFRSSTTSNYPDRRFRKGSCPFSTHQIVPMGQWGTSGSTRTQRYS